MNKFKQIQRIVNQIRPLLANQPPDIQGGVLIELLATFIAGHHPLLRDELLTLHVNIVRELVPECEAEIFATRERPPDWPSGRSE
jgi:hypothetical protein